MFPLGDHDRPRRTGRETSPELPDGPATQMVVNATVWSRRRGAEAESESLHRPGLEVVAKLAVWSLQQTIERAAATSKKGYPSELDLTQYMNLGNPTRVCAVTVRQVGGACRSN